MRNLVNKMIFLSAERADTQNTNYMRTRDLEYGIKASGMDYVKVSGVYKGTNEASFGVVVKSREDEEILLNFARTFSQESVLIRHTDGTAELQFIESNEIVCLPGRFRNISKQEAELLDAYTFDGSRYWAVV